MKMPSRSRGDVLCTVVIHSVTSALNALVLTPEAALERATAIATCVRRLQDQ
jgi:hypothetical protein